MSQYGRQKKRDDTAAAAAADDDDNEYTDYCRHEPVQSSAAGQQHHSRFIKSQHELSPERQPCKSSTVGVIVVILCHVCWLTLKMKLIYSRFIPLAASSKIHYCGKLYQYLTSIFQDIFSFLIEKK